MERRPRMHVQNRLRELRAKHGLSQEELARAIGVSRQTIIALEKGRYNPSVQVALLAAQVLQESVESIFWLESAPDQREER
jgi:putative transcriptional regulator